MKRTAAWLMFLCLMFMQAHGFVPHHHHNDEAPAHKHAADHHASFDLQGDFSDQFADPHPEIAPHDEASLSNVAPPHAPQFVMVLAMPDPIEIALPLQIDDWEREICPTEHPYATGPPGTRSARAPPASLTA